jgi:hypothetical protein
VKARGIGRWLLAPGQVDPAFRYSSAAVWPRHLAFRAQRPIKVAQMRPHARSQSLIPGQC